MMFGMKFDVPSPLRKAGTVALAVASLGAVTMATVEPAQAYRGGGFGIHRFGGGFGGFRGGYGRFGYGGWGGRRFGYGGWGGRRFGWGGYGYRRFGWGYPAIGFGLGYGLAAASYGYGYPYGGYGYGYSNAAYDGADAGGYQDDGPDRPYRHGGCDPYGSRSHLQKRYCGQR